MRVHLRGPCCATSARARAHPPTGANCGFEIWWSPCPPPRRLRLRPRGSWSRRWCRAGGCRASLPRQQPPPPRRRSPCSDAPGRSAECRRLRRSPCPFPCPSPSALCPRTLRRSLRLFRHRQRPGFSLLPLSSAAVGRLILSSLRPPGHARQQPTLRPFAQSHGEVIHARKSSETSWGQPGRCQTRAPWSQSRAHEHPVRSEARH